MFGLQPITELTFLYWSVLAQGSGLLIAMSVKLVLTRSASELKDAFYFYAHIHTCAHVTTNLIVDASFEAL